MENNLQIGDIILYRGKGILSKLVCFFTKSKYSHVSMMISNRHIIEANWNKKSNISNFKFNPKRMEVYRFKDGLSAEQQISIVQDSYDFLNKYYDYGQIFGYILEFFTGKRKKNPFNSSSKLICSELVDRAYLKINIDLVEYRADGNVTPEDIAYSIKRLGFKRIL